jgi:hypothetical protein
MREDSIFKNLEAGQNRFELCHQAFKAVRMLHNPGNRIQDTTNDALHRLADVVSHETTVAPAETSSASEVPAAIAPLAETVLPQVAPVAIPANL